MNCIFCNIEKDRILLEDENCIAFYDKYPVSKGHTLVIHRLHESNYFNLDCKSQTQIWNFVNQVKHFLDQEYAPDGINIGINIGETAGQTIFHSHIHMIPRYAGDLKNPKGGVRGVIPNKMSYHDS